MKAIRVHQLGEPEVMKLEDTPDPRPRDGEVLVAIRAAGVNPVDTYIRAGRYTAPPLPYTPGMVGAGVVEAVGAGVTRVKPGDRVYTAGSLSGTYAGKALCREAQVYALPERISFAQGAGVNVPCATAYRALFHRARAQPGEVVLVHGGSGGVGIAAIQLARHAGGKGADVILEMLANVNLGRDLTALAKHGRVVVIGSRGTVEIDPRETMGRDAAILGMTLMNATDDEAFSIHSALVAGLANGTLNPIVGKEMPLADAPRAHHEVIEGKAYGKIVLTV